MEVCDCIEPEWPADEQLLLSHVKLLLSQAAARDGVAEEASSRTGQPEMELLKKQAAELSKPSMPVSTISVNTSKASQLRPSFDSPKIKTKTLNLSDTNPSSPIRLGKFRIFKIALFPKPPAPNQVVSNSGEEERMIRQDDRSKGRADDDLTTTDDMEIFIGHGDSRFVPDVAVLYALTMERRKG
ncbi:hypothetical protein ACLOJK_005368 [Asimina triloba]